MTSDGVQPASATRGADASATRDLGLAVFAISALTLTLELVHARMLAFQFWQHIVYYVLTMGFLGYAASGTYLSVSGRVGHLSTRSFLASCWGGLALGVLVSRLVPAAFPALTFTFSDVSFLLVSLAYVVMMVPYFFGGLLVGGALQREPRIAGRLYFASLAGSAAGCLLFVALLRPLGAPGLLAAIFALSAVVALRCARASALARLAALVAVAAGTWMTAALPIRPDRTKQIGQYGSIDFTEWNPIARIDVTTGSGDGIRRILIDGDAQAPVTGSEIRENNPQRRALYSIRDPGPLNDVLVIGVGGGADVVTARKEGAHHVDAVEINSTTATLLETSLASATDGIFVREGVTLFNEDGRSFAARSGGRYDAVVLFAVDSLAAASTGAYVLMENYLYTKEAFARYWQLLSDRGYLQIGRWYYPGADREALRVFTQAFEVLASEGVADPGSHIIVLADAWGPAPFASVIVSKQPMSAANAARALAFAGSSRARLVYAPEKLLPRAEGVENPFERFAGEFAVDRGARFYRDYPFNVVPVSDDAPFFFLYRRWADLLPTRRLPTVSYYDHLIGLKPLVLMVVLVVQSAVMVAVLVAWPMLRRRGAPTGTTRADKRALLYFGSIGVAFMFVEVPLIQRFVLLLGHPTYSIAVTLPALLLGAGAGSWLSGRSALSARKKLTIAVASIEIALLLLHALRGPLGAVALAWPSPLRIALAGAVSATLGLFLGVPYPTAVTALADRPHVLSLGWAVNGGASVIASVLVIPTAMELGFTRVLAVAGCCYGLAWLALAPTLSVASPGNGAPGTGSTVAANGPTGPG